MLDKGLIAVALYRLPGATDNKFPYVWTNPEGATITNQDKVFVLAESIPKDLNFNLEDMNSNDNNFQFGNQYLFGHTSGGDLVKNYYGEDHDSNEEDSKYSSHSDDSSGNELKTEGKSGRMSTQIKFSKLDENDKSQLQKYKKHTDVHTESGIEEYKETKSRDTGNLKTSSKNETKKTNASSSKKTMAPERNVNQSSFTTTKTIVDSLAK